MISISNILYMIPGAVIAYTFHEFIKAFVSSKLGDPLPKARLRLTLNPITHFEPIGFICMLVLGYGWGKPVETSPLYYADRKKGTMLTYILPSLINLLIGIFFIILCNSTTLLVRNILLADGTTATLRALVVLRQCIYYAAQLNISMAFFNMIPVYPLDGAKILALFLSPNRQLQVTVYEKIFQIILVFLMVMGIVAMILRPFENIFMSLAITRI